MPRGKKKIGRSAPCDQLAALLAQVAHGLLVCTMLCHGELAAGCSDSSSEGGLARTSLAKAGHVGEAVDFRFTSD